MAINNVPSSWIPSWSEDGTTVSFPIASIPFLDATEADGTTGNISKVLFAILDEMFEVYNGLPTAEKPTKMTVFRSTSTNDATGTVTKSYQFVFNVVVGSVEVQAES